MKHTVDAMGKQCPIPVVMTKKILDICFSGENFRRESAQNKLNRLKQLMND